MGDKVSWRANSFWKISVFTAVAMFLFAGCKNEKGRRETFLRPTVLLYDSSFKDSVSYFNADCIEDASTFFISKFKFSDSVRIDNEGEATQFMGNDMVNGDSAFLRNLRDSISSDGLQVIPDYSVSIPVNLTSIFRNGMYYPVYVVNETNSDKLFTVRDRYVAAIQEAKDSGTTWRPVESRKFDFLGGGKRWALVLHPNEFALFLTAKFEGTYKTTMRIRMKIGDVIYLSKAFEGSINEKQFHLTPGSYQYNEYKRDKSGSITKRFLGSVPVDPDQK
jgi:hypothetical protein